jgi:hypothetical protein
MRHRRHTWATELLNCGMGLPALMKLMGHKSIQMPLRYLKVAQPDLQREFHRARQNSPQSYSLPSLSVSTATPDLPGIRQAVAATRHLLEMYRRQFSDDKTRRRLQRLDHRLLTIAQQLENISTPENEERLAGQPARHSGPSLWPSAGCDRCPLPAVGDQLQCLPTKRMVGMSYAETLVPTARLKCI